MAWSIFREGGGDEVAVGWAKQLLQKLGAPQSPGNIQFIYQWEKSEGGGGKYNPLNQGAIPGHPELTTSGSQFGGGANDYASWDAGLQGAYYGIHMNNYKAVLAGLMANDPTAARLALWRSPWAASHYGYTAAKGKASNWFYGTIPNGTPILPSGGNSTGGGSTGGSGGVDTGGGISVQPIDDPTSPEALSCAWDLNIPVAGHFCLVTKTEIRGVVAVLVGIAALAIGTLGVITLVAYGLKSNKATQVATSFIRLPGKS